MTSLLQFIWKNKNKIEIHKKKRATCRGQGRNGGGCPTKYENITKTVIVVHE